MTHATAQSLGSLVQLADSGTWGEAAPKGSGDPVLRSSNIVENNLDLTDVARRAVPMKHRQSKRLADGDIVVVTSSGSPDHIGKCCLFREHADDTPYYFSNFTLRLRPDPNKVNPGWLFYWLTSRRGRAVLEGMNPTTSGLRNLNKRLYLEQPMPLPPLAEQRRFVAMLDKADAVQRNQRVRMRLLDEFLRSAFLEMFGDPVRNEKGWQTARLGEVALFVGGGTPSRAVPEFYTGSIPWASSKDITSEDLLDTQEHVTPEAIEQSATRLVPPGSILIVVKSKILLHRLPVAIARTSVCFSQDIKAITPRDDRVPVSYLARHLRVGQQALLNKARGANTEGLTLEHLRDYRVMLPSADLLERWDRVETTIRALRGSFNQHRATGTSLFRALAQRAFGTDSDGTK